MTNSIKLTEEECRTIFLASRSVKIWRYGKWVQALLGLFLIGFTFWLIHQGHGDGAWEGIPHFVFGAVGAPLVSDALFSRRSREQRLLLKLYEVQRSSQSG